MRRSHFAKVGCAVVPNKAVTVRYTRIEFKFISAELLINIFDKDFKEIINKEDLDDKDYIKIKELINEVLESKKESDETDSKSNNEI